MLAGDTVRDSKFFLLREAALADAADIASLLSEAFAGYKGFYTPEAFSATTPSGEEIASRFKEGPIWVALQNNSIIGTLSGLPMAKTLYLRSMAVLPAKRGSGIGRALLQQAEDFAYANRYERTLLSTTPFLDSAIRLYNRFGYQHVDEGPTQLFGTPLIAMAKALTSSHKSISSC